MLKILRQAKNRVKGAALCRPGREGHEVLLQIQGCALLAHVASANPALSGPSEAVTFWGQINPIVGPQAAPATP
jgi:hypothetical protein